MYPCSIDGVGQNGAESTGGVLVIREHGSGCFASGDPSFRVGFEFDEKFDEGKG